jgi:hypothetical protein
MAGNRVISGHQDRMWGTTIYSVARLSTPILAVAFASTQATLI